ncbi:hypothetical protein K431DRAFT_292326 [Polychaeton citri CBS 116435]|uniref:Uncharacterized protein n=1 Tax=Polychaeton citri CBS 116435 TaxID=1314669 RepID=A0A9P4QEV8_9PEZI|nr:hypothetical protein K431DRAFT_292326 [Polychaeton citri CBS 116435]
MEADLGKWEDIGFIAMCCMHGLRVNQFHVYARPTQQRLMSEPCRMVFLFPWGRQSVSPGLGLGNGTSILAGGDHMPKRDATGIWGRWGGGEGQHHSQPVVRCMQNHVKRPQPDAQAHASMDASMDASVARERLKVYKAASPQAPNDTNGTMQLTLDSVIWRPRGTHCQRLLRWLD